MLTTDEDGNNAKPFDKNILSNKDWSYDNNSNTFFYLKYKPRGEAIKVGTTVSVDEPTQTLTFFKADGYKKTRSIEIGLDTEIKQYKTFKFSGKNKIIALKALNEIEYSTFDYTESQGSIINKETGKIEKYLSNMGTDVGFMSPAQLSKSKYQVEQPHERIIGLYKAPEAMKPIIIKEFDSKDAQCKKAGKDNELILGVYYRNNKEISFGTGVDSCAYSNNLYRKTYSGWVKFRPVSPANGLLDCADLDKYKISAKEYPKCNDWKNNRFGADGEGVPNKNP